MRDSTARPRPGWAASPARGARPAVTLAQVAARHWRAVLVTTVLGALLGLVVAALTPVRYEATAQVYPLDPRSGSVSGLPIPAPGGSALVPSTVSIATSPAVVQAVARALAVPEPDVRSRVRASGVESSDAVQVTAEGVSGEQAARTLKAVLDALSVAVDARRAESVRATTQALQAYAKQTQDRLAQVERQLGAARGDAALTTERAVLTDQVQTVQSRIRQLEVEAATSGPSVYLPSAVQVPSSPVRPVRSLDLGAGAVLGLALGVGWAWRRTERDPLVTTPEDVVEAVGVPVIGRTRRLTGGHRSAQPGDIAWEPPFLLESLLRSRCTAPEDSWPELLVVGVREGDAVGDVAVAVARHAARRRRRVLVAGLVESEVPPTLLRPGGDGGLADGTGSEGGAVVFSQRRPSRRPRGSGPDLVVACEHGAVDDDATSVEDEAAALLVVHRGTPHDQLVTVATALELEDVELLGCVFVDAPARAAAVRTARYRVAHTRTAQAV